MMDDDPLAGLRSPGFMATASYAPLTPAARAGLARFERSYDTAHPWDTWVTELEELRKLVADMLGVPPSQVALPSSACTGLASFLEGLISGPRRTILLAGSCFAGIAQACHAQVRHGVRVSTVPFDAIAELASIALPLAVVIPQICPLTGSVLDVDPVVAAAVTVGAVAIVDCSHGLGHLPAPRAPVIVSSGYKYLFGLPGIACIRIEDGWAERSRPSTTGWFAASDVLSLRPEYDPAEGARRFDAGTPSFPAVFALANTLRSLRRISTEYPELQRDVRESLLPLQDRGRQRGPCLRDGPLRNGGGRRCPPRTPDRGRPPARGDPHLAVHCQFAAEIDRVVDAICRVGGVDLPQ